MPRSSADRPNVIVFFTDQQRHDSTGAHGNPLDLTPNFDRMADRGTHAFHSFTPAPVCGPARACLQTGTHISTNGTYRNSIPLSEDLPNLAGCFNQGGYHTGHIGKWHLAGKGSRAAVPEARRGGYQDWLAANALEHTSDAYDCVMYDNEDERVKLPGYRVDAQTDAAIRYVDAHQDEPFFLFLSYLEPHQQNHVDAFPAPPGYSERYTGRWTPPDLASLPAWGFEQGPDAPGDRHHLGGSSQRQLGGYWGMVRRLDEALGRLFDTLKSLGLDQNTIVLFTSDHACHFKTRNREYKRTCHESSIRVPTALIGPGFTGGGRLEQMVSLVDLPPTLLDAAGITPPESMEGRSLLELVRREPTEWPEEMFVQVCDSWIGRAVRTGRWKYCVMDSDQETGVKPRAQEYVETFLYDLDHDPYELMNLIDMESHANVRQVMRQRLIRRMTALGEPEPKIRLVEPRSSGQRRVTDEEARM